MVSSRPVRTPHKVDSLSPYSVLKMPATAILQCRPNSHPFPDRTLNLDEPVKIGRSVARARPAPNNAIFDCKVLSRNHALLWYENGKFYLKDTKSSNGTFVNNYRLSKGSEESSPQEVCSGDIVQYGVDVMENSKKVTHGCIIATLKLYLPDGQEAKASLSTAVGGGLCNISSQELYQLRTSLQEAQHREQLIESKLASFQQIITSIQEAASQSWTAMIDEDRLLQRLETLEDQLATYAKNCSEDTTREEIRRIIEEKSRYEISAKSSMQRILAEKVNAVTKCLELERTLANTKKELDHKKEMADAAQEELQELLAKQTSQTLELKKVTDKLKAAEEKLTETNEKSELEKSEMDSKLNKKALEERSLLMKIECLKAENDFTKDQLNAIKAKYENIKNGKLSLGVITGTELKEFEFSEEEVKKTFHLFRTAVQALHERLWQAQEELHQTQSAITQLKNEAEEADKAEARCHTTKAQLQEELGEKKAKEEANSALIDHLQSQLGVLEARLRDVSPESPKIYEDIYEDNNLTLCKFKKSEKDEDNKDDEDNEKLSEKDDDSDSISDSTLTLITSNDIADKNSLNGGDNNKYSFDPDSIIYVKEDIIKLKDILSLAESSKSSAQEELARIRDEFGKASTSSITASHEAANLRHQLAANEAVLMEKTRYVSTLQEVGGQLDSSIELIYSHLSALTQTILQEKNETLKARSSGNDELQEKLVQAEKLSEESVRQMKILRAKLKQLGCGDEADDQATDFEPQPNDDDGSSQQDLKAPSLIASSTPEISSLPSSSSFEEQTDEAKAPSLEAQLEALKKAYEELRENEGRLREQLEANPTLRSVTENVASEAATDDSSSVAELKKELNSLMHEHGKLKERLATNDSDFQDLHLQNKLNIPTWLLFVLIIPVSYVWQWVTSWF